jgi:hypothetical protein
MNRILLFIAVTFISISANSQNNSSSSSGWKNSAFEEKLETKELKVYPNPCKKDKVTLDFNGLQISEIQLTSITGKQVLNKKLQLAETKITLKLNNIQNGMYLLKVKSTNNKIAVKKFIVSKK